jgi:hypothetical protein
MPAPALSGLAISHRSIIILIVVDATDFGSNTMP